MFARMGTFFPCEVSWLLCAPASALQPKHVFLGRTQRVFAGADAAPPAAGVTAALGEFAQRCLEPDAVPGGSGCLYNSPLRRSQCCLKGCLVNRIIKLFLSLGNRNQWWASGAELHPIYSRSLGGCAGSAVLEGGRAASHAECCSGGPSCKGRGCVWSAPHVSPAARVLVSAEPGPCGWSGCWCSCVSQSAVRQLLYLLRESQN